MQIIKDVARKIAEAEKRYDLKSYPLLYEYTKKLEQEFQHHNKNYLLELKTYINDKCYIIDEAKEDGRKDLVFLSVFPRVDLAKKSDALGVKGLDKYYRIACCSDIVSLDMHAWYRNYFDNIIGLGSWYELIIYLMYCKPDVIIARPRDQIAALAIIFSEAPVIFNLYDIITGSVDLSQYNNPLALEAEKFCFEHAAGIIHKGAEYAIDKYVRPHCSITSPVLHFLPYCWPELFRSQPIKATNATQLCYTGILSTKDMDMKQCGFDYIVPIINQIVNQELYFHVYYNPEVNQDSRRYYEYKELSKNSKYFQFHESEPPDKITSVISWCDYGVQLHQTRGTIYKPMLTEVSMSNKLFTYLEAGLPLIVGNNFKAVSDFVDLYGVGLTVDPYKIEGLCGLLSVTEYDNLVCNVLETREQLNIYRHIHKLEKLIDHVIDKGE